LDARNPPPRGYGFGHGAETSVYGRGRPQHCYFRYGYGFRYVAGVSWRNRGFRNGRSVTHSDSTGRAPASIASSKPHEGGPTWVPRRNHRAGGTPTFHGEGWIRPPYVFKNNHGAYMATARHRSKKLFFCVTRYDPTFRPRTSQSRHATTDSVNRLRVASREPHGSTVPPPFTRVATRTVAAIDAPRIRSQSPRTPFKLKKPDILLGRLVWSFFPLAPLSSVVVSDGHGTS